MNKSLYFVCSIFLAFACVLFVPKIYAQTSDEYCSDKNLSKYYKEVLNVADDEVKIIGRVYMPTTYKVRERSIVFEAIAMAGGIAKTDRMIEIKLIRKSSVDNKTPIIIDLDVRQIMNGKKEVKLQGGDLVFVAENCQEKENPAKMSKPSNIDKILPFRRYFPINTDELTPIPLNVG